MSNEQPMFLLIALIIVLFPIVLLTHLFISSIALSELKKKTLRSEDHLDELKMHLLLEKLKVHSNSFKRKVFLYAIIIFFFIVFAIFLIFFLRNGVSFLWLMAPIIVLIVIVTLRNLRKNKQKEKLMLQIPEAINRIALSLSAHLSMNRIIDDLAVELKSPMAIFFKKCKSAISNGATIEQALSGSLPSRPLFELEFLVLILTLHQKTGSSINRVLVSFSDSLQRQREIKLKIDAMLSEATMLRGFIVLAPIIVIIVLSFSVPFYSEVLFNTSYGRYFLVVIFFIVVLAQWVLSLLLGKMMR